MLGNLVPTHTTPVLHTTTSGGWLKRLIAFLFRRG
jgi:hypothetical protein